MENINSICGKISGLAAYGPSASVLLGRQRGSRYIEGLRL
jgi:hypothetical protein